MDGLFGAVQGFVSGMNDAENRKFRQMELDSRMRAQDEASARQKSLDEYNRQKDESEKKQKEFQMGADLRAKGFQIPQRQEGQSLYDVDPSQLKYDPEYLALKQKTVSAVSDPYGLKGLQAQKAKEEQEQREFQKTPQGRIEKLPGDARKRFDDTTGALDALIDIDSAYSQLAKKGMRGKLDMVDVPLRGGTQFTVARDQFIESLGRLQSGGAIGIQEVENFKNLLPSPTDDPEVATKKLADLKFRLASRLKTFGVSPEDASAAGFLKPSTAKGLMSGGLLDQSAGLMNQNMDQSVMAEDQERARLAELRAKAAKQKRVANGPK